MNKKSLFSQDEEQILLGGLLGDSHLDKKRNTVCFTHGEKQKEYLLWKRSKIERFSNKYYIVNSNGFPSHRFSTSNDKDVKNEIKKISLLIYDKFGKKRVSRKWLNKLTPLGLAIWWMDDGCLSVYGGGRYGKLCTHSFSHKEHLIIQKYFKVVWDINIQISVEKRKYYFCRLNAENLKKIFKIIYPYVLQNKNMIYKIDMNYQKESAIGDDYYYVYNQIKQTLLSATTNTPLPSD